MEDEGLHPFLLSYIANSLFVVYLPIHWAVQRSKQAAKAHARCISCCTLTVRIHPVLSGRAGAMERGREREREGTSTKCSPRASAPHSSGVCFDSA